MGGANKHAEDTKLEKGVNLIVATPGRLLDHLEVSSLRASPLGLINMAISGYERLHLPQPKGSGNR